MSMFYRPSCRLPTAAVCCVISLAGAFPFRLKSTVAPRKACTSGLRSQILGLTVDRIAMALFFCRIWFRYVTMAL